MKSIKKNYFYNLSYQILLILAPFITTPHLSRALGVNGIGKLSYAESIVSYFVLFASMGINIYGQREISYVQDDKTQRSKIFWETKILNIIISTFFVGLYLIFIAIKQYELIYVVLIFNLFDVMANITWLFQGLEEFGKIVARNFLYKLINIAYIFLFIHNTDDLIKYAIGSSFFLFISNVSLWLYLPQYVSRPHIRMLRPFRNFKVVISLFIPTIAIQIYTVLDKTMIGMITDSDFENGCYEQAVRITKMVLTVIGSLGTVMIPRIGYYFNRNQIEDIQKLMYRGYRFAWFLGYPLCFGLMGISSNFVPWFFGEDFNKVIPLLQILSLLILSLGINNLTGMQYLIPTKRQNVFTFTVLVGASINFILNLLLINIFRSIGAAIASVAAETIIAILQLIIVRKEISVKIVLLSGIKYFIAALIMLLLIVVESNYMRPSIMNTFIMVISGAFLYFILLLLLKDYFFIKYLHIVIDKIKKLVLKL